MATSYEVISLGTHSRIDSSQGNEASENAAGLLGTYGTATDPLCDRVRQLSPQRLSEDDNSSYDTDNGGGYDSFRIDGGTPQNFDGVATYSATITYVDGTTATLTATVFQDVVGNTYLAPEETNNSDQVALSIKPIQSLTLHSVVSNTGDMEADRFASNFLEPVNGTSGGDVITLGYVDAEGDAVTEAADFILAGGGDDTVNAGGGDDTIRTGHGHDLIEDWDGNDLVYAGQGNDTADVGIGNDTYFMEGGDDRINVWDNAGDNVFSGGEGSDELNFTNWQSADGVSVTFDAANAGSFSHFSGMTTGSFSGFERVSGTTYNDTIDASAATTSITLKGEEGDDALTAGAGADVIYGGAGNDTLAGGAGNDTIATGDGADVIELTDGGGADRISDFNMTRVDGKTIDQLDVSDLTNAEGAPVSWRDVTVTDTNGDGTGDAVLTFSTGEIVILEGVAPADATGKGNLAAMGIPCFASGTAILTPTGFVRVENLRDGDVVVTSGGSQTIIWAGHRNLTQEDLAQHPEWRPVHFPIGAINNTRVLRLAPQHAVLMQDATGVPVLVRAKHLAEIGFGRARVAHGVRTVCYHHILLPCHAIICSAGAPTESFFPGPQAMAMLDWPSRLGIAAAIVVSTTGVQGPHPVSATKLYGKRVYQLLDRASLAGLSSARFTFCNRQKPAPSKIRERI